MAMRFSILAGEFHEQRSLAGRDPCGHKESDMADVTCLLFKNFFYCFVTNLNYE